MRIALTFDCETPGRRHADNDGAEHILDILRDRGVRATFFVQGRWANWQPAVAARIAQDGHLIGNHSHHHAPMTYLSPDGFAADVREAEAAIIQRCGVDPRPWFRTPFGRTDSVVDGQLERLGYRNVLWDVHALDWEPSTIVRQIEASVVAHFASWHAGTKEYPQTQPVVLLHTWPRTTVEALPRIIDRLDGAEFITVADVAS